MLGLIGDDFTVWSDLQEFSPGYPAKPDNLQVGKQPSERTHGVVETKYAGNFERNLVPTTALGYVSYKEV